MPKYTADISEAWEVAHRMRDKGYDLVLTMCADYYRARFCCHETGMTVSDAVGDTAEEAISLAALRALGVDIE